MTYMQAVLVVLEAIREMGGFKKVAELWTRNRDEILRMQKELPDPGKSKGY